MKLRVKLYSTEEKVKMFEELVKSLENAADTQDFDNPFVRRGYCEEFSMTVRLARGIMSLVLVGRFGVEQRTIIKEPSRFKAAEQAGLITNADKWVEMREVMRQSHDDYLGVLTVVQCSKIKTEFLPLLKELLEAVKSIGIKTGDGLKPANSFDN